MSASTRFWSGLPKVLLHEHLDGGLREATLFELLRQRDLPCPAADVASLARWFDDRAHAGSLVEFLRGFALTVAAMATPRALERVAFEAAEDALADGCVLAEFRIAPLLFEAHGLSGEATVEALLAGLGRSALPSGLIVCAMRHLPSDETLRSARLAVAYAGRGVVGFDLAGAEADFPAKHHRAAFQLVRDNNVNCTIHAGEAYGPESIAQAIHVCGAHRIGHGCRLREDGDLLHYITDHRIPMECCPSSNVQTGAVKDFATHPLKLYFDLGVRVTINTDNRLITNTSVSKELFLVHTKLGVPFVDIKSMILAGVKSSFQPFHEKQASVRRVAAELERYDDQDGSLKATAIFAEKPRRGSASVIPSAE